MVFFVECRRCYGRDKVLADTAVETRVIELFVRWDAPRQ